jgi:hypothetical protein
MNRPGRRYELGPNAGGSGPCGTCAWTPSRSTATRSPGRIRAVPQRPAGGQRLRCAARLAVERCGRRRGPRRARPAGCYVNWSQAAACTPGPAAPPTEDEWRPRPAAWTAARTVGQQFLRPLQWRRGRDARCPWRASPRPAACGALDAGSVCGSGRRPWTAPTWIRAPEGLVNVAIRGGAFGNRRQELATRAGPRPATTPLRRAIRARSASAA